MKFDMIKDEGLRKALEDLYGLVGKNADVAERVADITTRATTGEQTIKVLRSEVDQLKADMVKRDADLKEAQQKARNAALEREGVRDNRRGLEILGASIRSALCGHLRTEIPAVFAPEAELLRNFRATLAAGSGDGANLVPTITEAMILDSLEEVSDLVGRTDFMPGMPGKMLIPVLTGRPTLQVQRAGTDTNMTQSDPAIGQVSFDPKEAYVFFPVDNRLIQMSPVQLGTMATGLIRDSLIEGLARMLVRGDGTAAYNSVTGILSAPAAYRVRMPAGKKAFGDLEKAMLTTVKSATLKRGRSRGSWVLSEEIMGAIEDISRDGKTPLVTYDNAGNRRVLMNPVVIDEDMPDLADSAADTPFIGFGDLATFLVGLVGGIQIGASTEFLFNRNQTAFRGTINADIIRKPVKTFTTLRTAADQ